MLDWPEPYRFVPVVLIWSLHFSEDLLGALPYKGYRSCARSGLIYSALLA